MGRIFIFIYKYFIGQILDIVNFVLSLSNEKIKKREEKWKNLLENIPNRDGKKRVLIHTASLGEFEQVKFLAEKLIEKDFQVITSFYSPSGFDNTELGRFSSYKVYMPIDSLKKSKIYSEAIKPDITLFVRYDLWYNHINSLKNTGSKLYLINATYTSNNFLGKSYTGKTIYKEILKLLDNIYVVNESNAENFKKITDDDKVNVLPDTRYDRIMSKVNDSKNDSKYKLKFDNNTIILGSIWKQDEDVIFSSIQKLLEIYQLNIIIVPHEPINVTLERIKQSFPTAQLLSEVSKNELPQITLVDSVGKLLDLYAVADIAYVGGAFGKGVHSVTEAAGYGIPIFCGSKKYDNSYDAINLKEEGGLFIVSNQQELYKQLKQIIDDNSSRESIGLNNYNYVAKKTGSSELLIKDLF